MQRILFVDDDVSVLSGLRRSLRGLGEGWEQVFAASGAEALDLCAAAPFDVVVSDARMPGMEGPELLAEIIQRHPDTVRLILSGQCSRGSVLKCVGVAHQFLSKPCESGALKATLQRIIAARRASPDATMRTALSRVQWLPSPAQIQEELTAGLARAGTSLQSFAEIIARDVALSAKVVQVVSSGFFGTAQRATSPRNAALLLGQETVTAICASCAAREHTSRDRPETLQAITHHSLTVGAAARRIAQTATEDQTVIADAFVAGTLHDIGTLALVHAAGPWHGEPSDAVRWGSRVAPQRDPSDSPSTGPRDPGGYLAALWGLADPVVQAIACHDAPAAATVRDRFTPLTAVHVAHACLASDWNDDEELHARLDLPYLESVGCLERLHDWQRICEAVGPPGALA